MNKDRLDLYLELFKEYRMEIRHQETQRSTISTICVAFAGALVGLSFQDKMTRHMWPYLGLLLINFSFASILMLRKLYERFELGRQRSRLYLKEIDKCLSDRPSKVNEVLPSKTSLEWVWKEGRKWGENEHSFLSFVRLHTLWESLLVGSALIGFLLLKASAGRNQSTIPLLDIFSKCNIWFLAVSGPIIQFIFLCGFQRWEESKYKEVKGRWDYKLLTPVRYWNRGKRAKNKMDGRG